MHLFFIRHGESTSNYNNLITGRHDVPLTEHGKEQARAAGQEIISKGIAIDRIISSSLMRARDTAKLIAEEIGFDGNAIEVNDLVIERSFGDLEGRPKGDTATIADDVIAQHGGELDHHIRLRATNLLEQLKTETGTVLVVSHTGFGRRLRAVVEGIPTEHSQNFENAVLTDLGEV